MFGCDSISNHTIAVAPEPQSWMYLGQHGPTIFDLWTILQNRDVRATYNKMMYKTGDTKDLKLKRENR